MNLLRNKRREQGFVLLSVMFIVLFLSIISAATFLRSDVELRETIVRKETQDAFYAAEAGIDRAISELRSNPDWLLGGKLINIPLEIRPGQSSTTIGFYSLQVEDGGAINNFGETRWVRSVGLDKEKKATRVILARVLIDDPADFLISSPGKLEIQSGAVIDADILGNDISFNVNKALADPDEKAITVNGDVLYISSVFPEDPTSDPDITINGDVVQYPTITFPGVDLPHYEEIAKAQAPVYGYFEDGDLTVDLNNLGALGGDPAFFQPLIIFATGNIHISGDIPHSMLVVAGGNIFITGDIEPALNNGATPQIGLFAKQNVIIPNGVVEGGGDLTLHAFVVADGGGSSNGEFKTESTVALGTLDFKGAISVRSEDPNTTGIDLNAFATRNYTHEPDLNIPFNPFIANILDWKEVGINDLFPPANLSGTPIQSKVVPPLKKL